MQYQPSDHQSAVEMPKLSLSCCSICAESRLNFIIAKENMFGMGDEFSYVECASCGHVALTQIPQNMQRYYPQNYYSFRKPHLLKTYLKSKRAAHSHGRSNWIGAILERRLGPDPTAAWFQHANVQKHHRILDVGCGSGIFLRDLQRSGYSSVIGVDPYIDKNYRYGEIQIRKQSIFDLKETFDFIMLNHSFEHMENPIDILRQLRRLLETQGTLLIRVPIIGEAWKVYREHWVGLDAPRHLFIPSRRSFEIMAQLAGLKIREVVYDSSDFQFWASEQYRAGIPLESDLSYDRNPKKSIFSEQQISDFRKKALEWNISQCGDQASFYLKSDTVQQEREQSHH